jgi:hypothetical protein
MDFEFDKSIQDAWLTNKARELEKYLKLEGAVKKAHNEKPGKHFPAVTGQEIEEALNIHPGIMLSVTVRALQLEIPLCVSGNGRYLGMTGEIATNASRRAKYMRALAISLKKIFITMGKTGTLDDAREFSKMYLEVDLSELPDQLRALKAPLPIIIEQILLEAGNGVNEDEETKEQDN